MNPDAQSSPSVADASPTAQTVAQLEARVTRHDVEVGDDRVCWRSLGQGSPLVLIHGGHGSWLHWVRNIEVLARQHTVWVPDLPSYGDSATLSKPEDLDLLVEVTAASIDKLLGAGTAINLAGFSFGGMISSRIAQLRGGVEKLALVGTAGHGTARRQTRGMVNWKQAPDRAAMMDALRHNLGAHMLYNPSSVDDLALDVHHRSCVATRFRSKTWSQNSTVPELLKGFSMPISIMWGEHDITAYPDQVGPMLVDHHPERKWASIEGSGHWVQFERADRVNQTLLQFFD